MHCKFCEVGMRNKLTLGVYIMQGCSSAKKIYMTIGVCEDAYIIM